MMPRGGGAHRSLVSRLLLLFRRGLALAVCAFVAVLAVAVLSGSWEVLPVLSGSMAPGMPMGSIAIAQREPVRALKLHDVAIFHPPFSTRVIYIHRVIGLQHEHGEVLVRTEGSANASPDPWTLRITSSSIFIVHYRIPDVGYIALWVHSGIGRATVLTGAGLLALALVIAELRDVKTSKRARVIAHDRSPRPEVVIDLRKIEGEVGALELPGPAEGEPTGLKGRPDSL